MARILLVRHGQSEWNAVGRWQGQADPPLTELGLRQAEAASMSIGTVDVIVASPLGRARNTAEVIAAQLGIGPVLTIDGLMERAAGEWEGLTRAEIDERFPTFLAEGRRPPGWEDDEDLLARALGALDAIARVVGHDGQIVAVTHGGVIMRLEDHLGGGHHRITNLGGRWIERRDDWLLGGRLDLLQDAGPLHEAPATSEDQI